MSVTLTPAAADRVTRFLEKEPGALGLRFGVKRTGCSGWQYVAELAHGEQPGDSVFEDRGIRVFVDLLSLPQVDGTVIDVEQRKLGDQFLFRNPNASAECGCGESFTTDADLA